MPLTQRSAAVLPCIKGPIPAGSGTATPKFVFEGYPFKTPVFQVAGHLQQFIPCGVNSNFRYWGDDENLDEELLEKRVKENCGDIACIIMEPLQGNTASIMPQKGFLEKVRELCDEHGIVMIMD